MEKGPLFGYLAEPSKSWLIVKPDLLNDAKRLFDGTAVNITSHGKKHLGAVIGHPNHRQEFVENLVKEWVEQIETLSQISLFEPQAAYTAFTSCLRHRYTFYLRTIPGISDLLQPLENAIRLSLIPALTDGRRVTDDERLLLTLPVRLGGLGLISPVAISDQEHAFSVEATAVLTSAILRQQKDLPPDLDRLSKEAKSNVRSKRRTNQADTLSLTYVLECLMSRKDVMTLLVRWDPQTGCRPYLWKKKVFL